jgi:hypothetical protein
MALTQFQEQICHLLANNRKAEGDAYVAGGVVLNTILEASRVSRDIDLFHDTDEALKRSWTADRQLLEKEEYQVEIIHERPAYVEALVSKLTDKVVIQWTRDSAFRFFPLIEDDLFGLVLHPLDLATNKCLALAGRLEPRDWIDMITCHRKLQPLGYLVWAACGKDVGFSPERILAETKRSTRFSREELMTLDFIEPIPQFQELASVWKTAVAEAECICETLPEDMLGTCVLDTQGNLMCASPDKLLQLLTSGEVLFHQGHIGGVLPTIRES